MRVPPMNSISNFGNMGIFVARKERRVIRATIFLTYNRPNTYSAELTSNCPGFSRWNCFTTPFSITMA